MKTKALLLLALASILCGCCSVSVTSSSPRMVTVENSCCYLLCCLPIFSGDPDYPNGEVCNWFDDTMKVETSVRLLEEASRRAGAGGFRNLVTSVEEEKIFWIFLKRQTMHTSAELIR